MAWTKKPSYLCSTRALPLQSDNLSKYRVMQELTIHKTSEDSQLYCWSPIGRYIMCASFVAHWESMYITELPLHYKLRLYKRRPKVPHVHLVLNGKYFVYLKDGRGIPLRLAVNWLGFDWTTFPALRENLYSPRTYLNLQAL